MRTFLREKKFISWAGGRNEKYTWQAAIAHNDFNDSSLNVYRRKRRWKRRSLVLRPFPCVHLSKITRGSHRAARSNSINAIRQMCVIHSMYLAIFKISQKDSYYMDINIVYIYLYTYFTDLHFYIYLCIYQHGFSL